MTPAEVKAELGDLPRVGSRWFDVAPDVFAEHVSDGRWKAYGHLKFLADIVVETVLTKSGRLIVNMPPRMGKSLFNSVWFPIWHIEQFPHRTVACVSYEAPIAEDFGRLVRNEFRDNDALRESLSQDSESVKRFHTTKGGGMISVGVGGALTGRGFHLGIVDDPYKGWKEAYSPTIQKRVIDWYNGVFRHRAEPGASMIINMTRYHPNDLVGWLLKNSGERWRVVSLPALALRGDPMGRPEGAPLCPDRYPLEEVLALKAGILSPMWEALHMQRPTGAGTGRVYSYFTQENVQPVELRPGFPLHLSADFNVNPGTHFLLGQHDPRTDEFILAHELYVENGDTRDALNKLFRWAGENGGLEQFKEIHVFGDSSGKSRTLVTSESCYDMIARELHARGKMPYRIRVPDQAPSVRDSVDSINDAFCDTSGRRRYLVNPRCSRTIRDFLEVFTDEKGQIDKTDMSLTHPSDAQRYWVHYLRPIQSRARPRNKVGV
jgi:hypothetical protein